MLRRRPDPLCVWFKPHPYLLLATACLGSACAARADLTLESAHCTVGGSGELHIEIRNQGGRTGRATTTVLRYPGRPEIHLPTPPILKRATAAVAFPTPPECIDSDCTYEVEIDFHNEVEESDERNNLASGACAPRTP